MSNSWFRLYAEILHDHKVQLMSESYRWRLVALMCIRCNVSETLHDSTISFHLRITEKEWQATKKVFIENKFIDLNNNLINWNKRQFISDNSTDRSRKHREKIKMQRCRDVSATSPDTDTDTDTDINKLNSTRAPARALLSDNFLTPEENRMLNLFTDLKMRVNLSGDLKALTTAKALIKAGVTLEEASEALKIKLAGHQGDRTPHPSYFKEAVLDYKRELELLKNQPTGNEHEKSDRPLKQSRRYETLVERTRRELRASIEESRQRLERDEC